MSESHCIRLRIMETFISMWGPSRESSGCCYETINYYQGLWNNTAVGGATPHRNTNGTFQYNFFSFSLANQTHNLLQECQEKSFHEHSKLKPCVFLMRVFHGFTSPPPYSGILFIAIFYFCPLTCFAVFFLAHSSSSDRHLLPACCFIWLFTWCPLLPQLPSLLCFIFLGLGICTVYLFVVCFAGPVVASN